MAGPQAKDFGDKVLSIWLWIGFSLACLCCALSASMFWFHAGKNPLGAYLSAWLLGIPPIVAMIAPIPCAAFASACFVRIYRLNGSTFKGNSIASWAGGIAIISFALPISIDVISSRQQSNAVQNKSNAVARVKDLWNRSSEIEIGMSVTQIKELLGEPDSRNPMGNADVWIYPEFDLHFENKLLVSSRITK